MHLRLVDLRAVRLFRPRDAATQVVAVAAAERARHRRGEVTERELPDAVAVAAAEAALRLLLVPCCRRTAASRLR